MMGLVHVGYDSFYVYTFDTPEINTVLLPEPVSLITDNDILTRILTAIMHQLVGFPFQHSATEQKHNNDRTRVLLQISKTSNPYH